MRAKSSVDAWDPAVGNEVRQWQILVFFEPVETIRVRGVVVIEADMAEEARQIIVAS